MFRKRNGAVVLMMGMLGSAVSAFAREPWEGSKTEIPADTYFDPAKWVRGLGYMAEHVSISRTRIVVAFH
jgi:hypothetical protein